MDVVGLVQKSPIPIEGCTQSSVELFLQEFWVVSMSDPRLPLQIDDAARRVLDDDADEDNLNIRVNQDTRLDNRVLDLRTPTNQAIYRIEMGVCKLFRDALEKKVCKSSCLFSSRCRFSEFYAIVFRNFRDLLKFILQKLFRLRVKVVRTCLQCHISKALRFLLKVLSCINKWQLLRILKKFIQLAQVRERRPTCFFFTISRSVNKINLPGSYH